MQIVIPMSGFGERFRAAGYTVPKPLIEIDGKPVIAHVIDMFPGESDFVFICNKDHLAEPAFRMAEILQRYCPAGRIVGIDPHKKGPVHAVMQVADLIDRTGPVVVNYCDFTCYWDWQHFKSFVRACACDGAIPAYKGFHPHSLGTTNYAYMREHGGWVSDIQEKQPYTDNRMQEYASSGTYYFATGARMLDAFRRTIAGDLNVGGEYYVSLAYKPLFADGARVAVYELQHFMQWGTPEDVRIYRMWSDTFRALHAPATAAPGQPAGTVIVPMAGLGKRFSDEGYAVTKPLIKVSGKPMVVQATDDLPPALRHVFVLRQDMPGHDDVAGLLARTYAATTLVTVPGVTQGQACSALLGLDAVERELAAPPPGPVTFGACDNGALYDHARLQALLDDPAVDVVVWGVRGYANAALKPTMYGWIDADDEGAIRGISVKQPLRDPATDPLVLGTFSFRRPADFRRCVERMIARNARVNDEFYIDTCINDAVALGLNCRLFLVDAYLCWGTPNDLRTFAYWQSCFHKWPGHPYRLAQDAHVPPDQVTELEQACRDRLPPLPA
jgi:NDP-sugar pyrophosphorylase family protein